ncbi:hypothetical protein HJA60_004299 [Vibrio vulnificus]|nr:hypothetical protein [Vibrio vulnificus]
MNKEHIDAVSIDGKLITLTKGKTPSYEECVVVHYQGTQGWGVSMNILPAAMPLFLDNKNMQREFIAFAKDKLGEQ